MHNYVQYTNGRNKPCVTLGVALYLALGVFMVHLPYCTVGIAYHMNAVPNNLTLNLYL